MKMPKRGRDFILAMIYGIKPRAFLQSPSNASILAGATRKGNEIATQHRWVAQQQALKTHMHRHMVPGAFSDV